MTDEFDEMSDDDDFAMDEPLPGELQYLDIAAAQVVRPQWIGHPPWRAPELSADDLRVLAEACEKLRRNDHVKLLEKWLHSRMAEEAMSRGKLEPIGGRIYGLVMLIVVLAEAKTQPFAECATAAREDRPNLCGCSNSKRSAYTGPPALCEATEREPAACTLPTDDPNRPYLLSHAAADRLEHRCLSPIEWYRLVVRHGRNLYHLWQDFYGNDGYPCQCAFAVHRSPGDGIPRLEDVRHDLPALLDFTLFHLQLDEKFIEQAQTMSAVARFGRPAVEAELDRRHRAQPTDRIGKLCWKVRVGLGYIDEARLRQRWAQVAGDVEALRFDVAGLARDSLPILAAAATIDLIMESAHALRRISTDPSDFISAFTVGFHLRDCMGADMLLELVLWLVENSPESRLTDQVSALYDFRNERVLDWIEQHARGPITYEWGTAAAVNKMSWPRVRSWLARGRPLSLIALDVMKNCRGYDKTDDLMSGVLRDYSPIILGHPAEAEVRDTLAAYASRDPDPRVRDTVAIILANLPKIFGRKR